jgi:hypothetical protein
MPGSSSLVFPTKRQRWIGFALDREPAMQDF